MKKLNQKTRTSMGIKTFDFKKEIETAITSEELRKRTTEFIKSLNWKR